MGLSRDNSFTILRREHRLYGISSNIEEHELIGTIDNYYDILTTSEFDTTIDDVGSEDKMDLEFVSKKEITLYGVYDSGYIQEVIKDKELIKNIKLYESLNTALAITNVQDNARGIIKCTLDITDCFDLLNLKDMRLLQDYYILAIKNKKIAKGIEDAQLLKRFMGEYKKYKAIRILHTNKTKIHSSSNLNTGTYIQYKIINSSCIKDIKQIK